MVKIRYGSTEEYELFQEQGLIRHQDGFFLFVCALNGIIGRMFLWAQNKTEPKGNKKINVKKRGSVMKNHSM